jgi:hypothetical protein
LELSHLSKATDFVNSLSEIKMKVGEEETPYFDKEFLIQRYVPLSRDEFEKNKEYKKKEEKAAKAAEKAKGGEEKEGGEGGEPGDQFTL